MTTTIHIQITEEVHVPTRRHVQTPADDKIVQDWFEIQKNPSASVRMLIHDDVMAHGMGDRITRAKFGSAVPTQPVSPPAPTPAASPAPAQAPSAVPTAVPAPTAASSMLTMPDARDDEIARLNAELGRLQAISAFISELDREESVVMTA